jgi:hypothetical protein
MGLHGKNLKRKGFMNMFFSGALMVVMLCFLVLTEEAADMRYKRGELEEMLQFDYRVEAYYLLLETGSLTLDGERGYGSFTEYFITDTYDEKRYIEITDCMDYILIAGFFEGSERGHYEVWR